MKFFIGYLSARPTEYSPYHNLAPRLQDYHFKEISVPLPFKGNKSPTTSSLVG
jgi:hypothetical protein